MSEYRFAAVSRYSAARNLIVILMF